jgi:hypothetical protein
LFGTDEAFLPLIEALEERCRGEDGPLLLTALRAHAPTWLVAQMPACVSACKNCKPIDGFHRLTMPALTTD